MSQEKLVPTEAFDRSSLRSIQPADSRLEDYLDHVCAPLVGVAPYARRQELRAELRSHLQALADSCEELGSTPDVAILTALRQFGNPRQLSRQWAQEWNEVEPPARSILPWRSARIGLASFGAATLAAFVQFALMTVPGSRLVGSGLALALAAVGVLFPICAGLAIGSLAKDRPTMGAFMTLACCIAVLSGISALPRGGSDDMTLIEFCGTLALVQAGLWMPLGCGAAALGGWLKRVREARPGRWVLQ